MHRPACFFALAVSLCSLEASGAQRKLTLKTFDGRVISGVLVLETDRSLLLRTEQGNVTESTSDEPGGTVSAVRLGPGLRHEVSLSGSMLFAGGPSNFAFAGGLGVLKYAYLF